MKTTKRIIAVVLAVLMLALMVPFAVSAEGDEVTYAYNATITAKDGYKITVYKIGTFDESTNTYVADSSSDTSIQTAVQAVPASAADIRTACEAAQKAGKTIGTAQGSEKTAGSDGVVTFGTNTPGVYFAAVTGAPAGKSVKTTGGSVFYLTTAVGPNDEDNTNISVDISGKISDGTPTVDKKILNSDMQSDIKTTSHIGKDVTFLLRASTMGSTTEAVTKYIIKDNMSAGLTYKEVSLVYLDEESNALAADTDYTVAQNGQEVSITLVPGRLASNGFYDASNVYVKLVATVNENAVKGRAANDEDTSYENTVNNWNKDSLEYSDSYVTNGEIKGTTVHVYTFELAIKKYDSTSGTAKTGLGGAKFTVTGPDNYRNTNVVTASDGTVTLSGLKKGKYTIVETEAPKGYNINNTSYEVDVNADGSVTGGAFVVDNVAEIPNTPVIMPASGGQGTMIFTIVGASLIACAGILFVIVRKKKSSK